MDSNMEIALNSSRSFRVSWLESWGIENLLLFISPEYSTKCRVVMLSLPSCQKVDTDIDEDWTSERLNISVFGLQRTGQNYVYKVCAKQMIILQESFELFRLQPSDIRQDPKLVQVSSSTEEEQFKMDIDYNISQEIRVNVIKSQTGNDEEKKEKKEEKEEEKSQCFLLVMDYQDGCNLCEKVFFGKIPNMSVPVEMMTTAQATIRVHYLIERQGKNAGAAFYRKGNSSEIVRYQLPKPPPDNASLKGQDLTKQQLSSLMTKATDYNSSRRMSKLSRLHRAKPPTYFDKMLNDFCGVMEPYVKDYNGDRGCPINGEINGLFFSAMMHGGNTPNKSPFGSRQVLIEALFHLKDKNLYFADFYCIHKHHYVTVVATRPDSKADRFCKEKLLPLDPSDNPFIRVAQNDVCVTNRDVKVEVFYTEDVDIQSALDTLDSKVELRNVGILGTGRSTKNGYPKQTCSTCNL